MTTPNYTFSGIPNNRAGRSFIESVRKFLNREAHQLVIRTNGPRTAAALKDGFRARAYDQSLPMRHAKAFRLYFPASRSERQRERREWLKRYKNEQNERDVLNAKLRNAVEVAIERQRRIYSLIAEMNAAKQHAQALQARLHGMPRLSLLIETIRNAWRKS